ncbi:TPA: hypothetical protein RQ688_000340 [Klebsiella pneumoniae]|nr:hypothetical protein [Klebsiella pneumoniae]
MANLPETSAWESGIHQLEESERAKAGPGGILNLQAAQLANRTQFLRGELNAYNGLIKSGELPFADLDTAQAAIVAGKIPEGSLFSFRSSNPAWWAEEGKNIGGVAVKTGKIILSDLLQIVTVEASSEDSDGTIAGLASTKDSQYFFVVNTIDKTAPFNIFRNNNGVAESVSDIIGYSIIQGLIDSGFILKPMEPSTGYVLGCIDPISRRMAWGITIHGEVIAPLLKLEDGSIHVDKLTPELQQLVPVMLDPATGYVFGLQDPVTTRFAMLVAINGAITMPLLNIPDKSVDAPALSDSLSNLIPVQLDPSTGYVFGLRDPITLRFALLVSVTGETTIPLLVLGKKIITMDNLADDVTVNFLPQPADIVDARPEPLRAAIAEVSVRTVRRAGHGWAPFPSHLCRSLSGVNTSGVALQFRRTAGLQFTGKAFVGSYSPGILQSKVKKGRFTTTPVNTPSGTFNVGDYYTYEVYAGNNNLSETTPGTWNGQNIFLGDLLVYDGSTWAIQQSPGRGAQRAPDMYVVVDSAGWFDGMELAAGDKLIFLTNQTAGGARLTPTWVNVTATSDRLFYAGEFTPSSLPVIPVINGVYQASAAGVIGVDSYISGDYAWFNGSEWIRIPNDAAVFDVPAGGSVSLRCHYNSDEWEVRRTDKNDVQVAVRMKGQVMSQIQEVLGEKQLLISDSMFGQGNTGNQIITATGIPGEVRSYGGATSEQVLGMYKKEILSWGDNYRAQTIVMWHGQNNQPTTDLNAAAIREVTMQMAQLAGARDIKVLFLSILGQRIMTWNGSRIVVQQHEDQFSNTGALYDLSTWYKKLMPGRYAICYEILLSAATDAVDPTFPGMTEKEVAAKFGVIPWSFFNGSSLMGVTSNQLLYKGTWTGTTLPTGGSHGDYYLRTDTTNIGNVIYNSNGIWIENTIDRTHLSIAGGAALTHGGEGFDLGSGYKAIPSRDGVAAILLNNHFYR